MLEKTHWYGNNLNKEYYSLKILIGTTLRETISVYHDWHLNNVFNHSFIHSIGLQD
jgi:hypothetical protein